MICISAWLAIAAGVAIVLLCATSAFALIAWWRAEAAVETLHAREVGRRMAELGLTDRTVWP